MRLSRRRTVLLFALIVFAFVAVSPGAEGRHRHRDTLDSPLGTASPDTHPVLVHGHGQNFKGVPMDTAATEAQARTSAAAASTTPGREDSNSKATAANTRPVIDECPALYPQDHRLRPTGRRALVVYTLGVRDDPYERQLEMDNYAFFRRHGIFAPSYATALFSGVDYAIVRVNMNRPPPQTSDHAPTNHDDGGRDEEPLPLSSRYGVRECSRSRDNVRTFEAPSGPCDICAVGRVFLSLGGAGPLSRRYEYVVMMNSGVRGPFFTEAEPPLARPENAGTRQEAAPVTWIDHLALGGEPSYTGRVVTGTSASTLRRPHLQTFAFSFPSTALPSVLPVLVAGCDVSPIPPPFKAFARSFDFDLTAPAAAFRRSVVEARFQRATGDLQRRTERWQQYLRDHPAARGPGTDALQAAMDAGAAYWGDRHTKTLRKFKEVVDAADGLPDSKGDAHKRKCIARSELQLMRAVFDAVVPLRQATEHDHPARAVANGTVPAAAALLPPSALRLSSVARAPELPDAEIASLSPALRRAIVEGPYYVVRSQVHNQTMLNMGHAEVVLDTAPFPEGRHHVEPTKWKVDVCLAVFPKMGGGSWRGRWQPPSVVADAQAVAVAQAPPHGAAKRPGGSFRDIHGCLSPR